MTDFYDDAMRYRKLAQELERLINDNAPCVCIMTDEYIVWGQGLEKLQDPLQRVRYLIENEPPNPDDACIEECWRCKAIGLYQDGMGEEAIEYEHIERVAELQRDGVLPVLSKRVLEVFDETFSEYDNDRVLRNLVGIEEDPFIQMAIQEALEKVKEIHLLEDNE
jgi:hypothetical protein